MAEMGKYCKAYLAEDLRKYPQWEENLANLRQPEADGDEKAEKRSELKNDDILYLQENYVVTDGIFIDENIIFDKVTDDWKNFASTSLEFEIPVYEPIEIKTAESESSGADA